MAYRAVGACVKYNNKLNELKHEFKIRKIRKCQCYLNSTLNPMTLHIRTFIYLIYFNRSPDQLQNREEEPS